MNLRKWLTTILLFPILLAACTAQSKRISSHQREIDNLRREIRFLKDQNSVYNRELDQLNKKIEELELTSRREKADLMAQLDELRRQLEIASNKFEDTNYRISELRRRGQTTDTQTSTVDPTSSARQDSMETTGANSLVDDQSRELYNTAYRDLIRGNYQLALHGFRQYLNQYQNSDLADNAQYWIGEVFYAQGRYPNAIEEFEKVVRLYRNGDKTASSLLKIAYAYINIDETEQGKLYLEEVIKEYPDSEEADLAKGRLASLN